MQFNNTSVKDWCRTYIFGVVLQKDGLQAGHTILFDIKQNKSQF